MMHLRRRAGPWVLGASFVPWSGQAQVGPATDEEVLRGWQAAMPGSSAPVLTPESGGGTRLSWTGFAVLDGHSTRVRSGSGQVGSPLFSGEFGQTALQGDARWVRPDGTVDSLAFRALYTNDRAVLPRTNFQIGNVQMGRAASTYSIASGDVAPDFSKLSSSLGVRGVLGRYNFGPAAVSGFAGLVAESWEALGRDRLRTQPTRTVEGAKVDVPVGDALRVYATTQQYREERLTSDPSQPILGDARSRSSSAGMQYAKGDLQLAAEFAASRIADELQGDRSARAAIFDGTWRVGPGAVRFGAHDIDPGYTSLATGAMPGVEEAYLAADWPMFPWLSVGGDVRRSHNTTLATAGLPAYATETDAASLNASINFGADWPGWTLALQRAQSQARAFGDQRQGNGASSTGLSYYGPEWNLALSYMRNRVENSSLPEGDSVTAGWNSSVRRTWAAQDAADWALALGVNGKTQVQRFASGQRSDAGDVGLQWTMERSGVASINATAAIGTLTQSQDGASVQTRSLQADVTVPLRARAQLKVYARYNTRRGLDPSLELDERTGGVQLTVPF